MFTQKRAIGISDFIITDHRRILQGYKLLEPITGPDLRKM